MDGAHNNPSEWGNPDLERLGWNCSSCLCMLVLNIQVNVFYLGYSQILENTKVPIGVEGRISKSIK